MEDEIALAKEDLNIIYKYLRFFGIGGVVINGIFRNLE